MFVFIFCLLFLVAVGFVCFCSNMSLAIIHKSCKDKYIVLHPDQVQRSPSTVDPVCNDCGFSTPDYAFA